jgi:hypothetical protein
MAKRVLLVVRHSISKGNSQFCRQDVTPPDQAADVIEIGETAAASAE